jgi:hypothetical protein
VRRRAPARRRATASPFQNWHTFPRNARRRRSFTRSPATSCGQYTNRVVLQVPPTTAAAARRRATTLKPARRARASASTATCAALGAAWQLTPPASTRSRRSSRTCSAALASIPAPR